MGENVYLTLLYVKLSLHDVRKLLLICLKRQVHTLETLGNKKKPSFPRTTAGMQEVERRRKPKPRRESIDNEAKLEIDGGSY